MLITLKRRSALTVSAALLAGLATSVAFASPRAATRPNTPVVGPNVAADSEQVLSEGGTLAAFYLGNLADIVGAPIPCTASNTPGRDCAPEDKLPAKPVVNPQFLYAAVGTGGAQLDFVNEQSGFAQKTAQTPAPVFADSNDAYSNTSPYGYTKGWAGAAPSNNTTDTLHFAAGDAPIPLGPAENGSYVPSGFTIYADSLAAFDNAGSTTGSDQTGGGFNPNRGPAITEPVIATGVSVIYNTQPYMGNSGLAGSINLSQDSLCAIFTGVYTNWSQVPEAGGVKEPITIVHRSDGSGTTFLFSYDMSKMCSASNPISGEQGAPKSTHFWGSPMNIRTQGVGTDSNNFGSGNTIPTDSGAPQVVWPAASVGASKSSGVLAAVEATPGAIGYISPAYAGDSSISEMNVQNYVLSSGSPNYEPANGTTVAKSISTFAGSGSAPPGYPESNKSAALYFPFPTATAGDALVGFSYGFFYTCSMKADADQVAAIKKLFEYEAGSGTSATAAAVAAFWNLNALPSTLLKRLDTAVSGLKTGPVTTPTSYINPATGATDKYTCKA